MNLKIFGAVAIAGVAAYNVLKAVWKLDHSICSPMHEELSKEVAKRVKQYRDTHPDEVFTDYRIKQLRDQYYEETMLDLRKHQDEAFKNRFRHKR